MNPDFYMNLLYELLHEPNLLYEPIWDFQICINVPLIILNKEFIGQMSEEQMVNSSLLNLSMYLITGVVTNALPSTSRHCWKYYLSQCTFQNKNFV